MPFQTLRARNNGLLVDRIYLIPKFRLYHAFTRHKRCFADVLLQGGREDFVLI